jgi:hypothetical protein
VSTPSGNPLLKLGPGDGYTREVYDLSDSPDHPESVENSLVLIALIGCWLIRNGIPFIVVAALAACAIKFL